MVVGIADVGAPLAVDVGAEEPVVVPPEVVVPSLTVTLKQSSQFLL